MTEAASAASDDTQARVHVPERSVPGAEPELREVEGTAPAQATEEVLVLDFGGQYSQLIARRIRECGVFSELLPHDTPLERIKERGPKGLVLSGTSPDGRLVEMVELRDHPYFVGCQFHPEFKSRPQAPHPLFQSFVAAALRARLGNRRRRSAEVAAAASP